MEVLLLIVIGVLVSIILILVLTRSGSLDHHAISPLQSALAELQASLAKIESGLKEDFHINRQENATIARENRAELNGTLKTIIEQSQQALKEINSTLSLKVEALMLRVDENHKVNREEHAKNLSEAFRGFRETFDKNVESFNNLQREKFAQLEQKQQQLIESTEKKLEQMRETVDEKLQKTLNERLGQSFELVGKQLESVQKGLGEMQTIASDVGGLKKVLSNVKLRGGVGEVQLAMLLEQILAPAQYDVNVCTKSASREPVEFAIKLPGPGELEDSFVYLPIDAKFPKDIYEQLLTAYEIGIPEEIDAAAKNLEATLKRMARDIRDKYIDPPQTTDFAILFLPFESIYAEVIRRNSLVDQLRDEFKITVAGPTTLAALLNSLQMGFRTLALQKRSSEVWKVLGAVKTEFEKFGGMLEKAQKNLHTASDTVDELLGKRTKAINRKLKQVQQLPAAEVQNFLPDTGETELEDDSEG
jgi:DNA recombination protein RmuC